MAGSLSTKETHLPLTMRFAMGRNGKTDTSPPDLAHEAQLSAKGFRMIAGVDEAGRGPLAGPVVASAVIILDPQSLSGVTDSKALSAKRREAFFARITAGALVGIGVSPVLSIERTDIRKASRCAMARALSALPVKADAALIDGRDTPNTDIPCEALIGGDGKSLSIAAASVVAKVWRDRIMDALAVRHPTFGWQTNRGYGSKAHMAALIETGPSAHHRRTFAPVRAALEG